MPLKDTRKRYLVPNLFTSFNFLLGVWSICYTAGAFSSPGGYEEALRVGAHLILISALLDKLDGIAARLMNASSEFGAQFDSLADLIAFGLAPAFALFFAYKNLAPEWFSHHTPLMIIILSLFVLTAAMRLAKYNAVDSDAHPNYFMGLPSTFAGIINSVMIWLMLEYNFFTDLDPSSKLYNLPIIVMAATALLMVSPLYLSKIRKYSSKLINVFVGINVIGAYICGFALIFPEYLTVLVLGYFVIGFGYGIIKRDKIHGEEEKLPASH
jgi:CDP-diacylglycerol--serine O-phosphatidyltransferase